MPFRGIVNDDPPYSRLFIISGKGISENDYRESFGKFGDIQDVWILRDRQSNDEKGIVYIKFAKTSAAFLAMEEMNGRCIAGCPKPLKVLIASSKREGSVRDPREDERLIRLFVIVPKSYSESELREEFEKYGDVEYVTIMRDRKTGDKKGFGYVKYHRPYHAALAYETCDAKFKPKFAEPKVPRFERETTECQDFYDYSAHRGVKRGYSDGGVVGGSEAFGCPEPLPNRFDGGGFSSTSPSYYRSGPLLPLPCDGFDPSELLRNYSHNNCQRLHITAPIGLSQSYLTRLFSLIPCLEYCDLNETTGVAYARYSTPQWAAYAQEKLDGFEYPICSRLQVRFADSPDSTSHDASPNKSYEDFVEQSNSSGGAQPSFSMDTFGKAAVILKKAGIDPDTVLNKEPTSQRVRYCNLTLPTPQPLRPDDTPVEQRLFVICQPSAVPEKILRDVFSRFGDLIDVYLLSGRNYGYAKFASKENALIAMHTLHGQNIAGQRLKVVEAEPPRDNQRGGTDDEPTKKLKI